MTKKKNNLRSLFAIFLPVANFGFVLFASSPIPILFFEEICNNTVLLFMLHCCPCKELPCFGAARTSQPARCLPLPMPQSFFEQWVILNIKIQNKKKHCNNVTIFTTKKCFLPEDFNLISSIDNFQTVEKLVKLKCCQDAPKYKS